MAIPLSQEKSRYTALDTHDSLDLEDNDSDATLASTGFLPKRSRRDVPLSAEISNMQTVLVWFRWGTVIALQTVILFFLLWKGNEAPVRDESNWTLAMTETGGDVNGLYIPLSHKYTLLTPEEEKFVPNMTSDVNRMEVRRNWDMLMPLGSGTVEIPDWESHPMLGKPIVDDPSRNGSIYEASWTHALHCLYYTVDTYHQIVVHGKFGFDGERDDSHATHCFEYLRNQILCMSDMTLEGSASVLDATGEGQAHVCRNRREALDWIEERRVDDIQSIVGPN